MVLMDSEGALSLERATTSDTPTLISPKTPDPVQVDERPFHRLDFSTRLECLRCQRPFAEGTVAGSLCAPCLAQTPRHDGIAAATLYNDASRRLVLAYKHGHRIALAPLLARLILARLPALEGEWIVVPVPLHRWRLWSRGFNQAALLAREIARTRQTRLLVDALIRRKRTPMLGGLGRKARARALSGAIAANPRRGTMLKGANIVLVDDVLTSGATTDACVSALKRAGAAKVMVACFARVLDEALPHT